MPGSITTASAAGIPGGLPPSSVGLDAPESTPAELLALDPLDSEELLALVSLVSDELPDVEAELVALPSVPPALGPVASAFSIGWLAQPIASAERNAKMGDGEGRMFAAYLY